MQRRSFIHAAAASVLLPAAAKPALAALADASDRHDYIFFDERFAKAQRIVASWAASTRPTPVHSDVTALWNGGLDPVTRDHVLRLRGVTTQSFLFCLRVLATEHAHVDARVSRLDRYLFAWTLDTTPRNPNLERHHG